MVCKFADLVFSESDEEAIRGMVKDLRVGLLVCRVLALSFWFYWLLGLCCCVVSCLGLWPFFMLFIFCLSFAVCIVSSLL